MDEEVVPILRVADAALAVAWYGRPGFSKEWEFRFDPDCPWFGSIARGRARLFLSEHLGDARPGTLVRLSVSDLDAVGPLPCGAGVLIDLIPASALASVAMTTTPC